MDDRQGELRGDNTGGADSKGEGQVLGKLKKSLRQAGETVSGLAGRLKAKLVRNKTA